MSWLLNLYKTYESHTDQVGVIEHRRNGQEFTLLPVSHTTQNAHIQVNITEDGEFHSAEVVGKDDASTVIPSTEDSASRTSAIVPYPLHDKLSYVAGDFLAYGGKIKKEEPFAYYIKQLEHWANSPYANAKVQAIYRYLSKRRLIQDLVSRRVLYLDSDGKLMSSWDKKYEALYGEKPAIFTVLPGEQEGAFVRFNVYSPHKTLTKVWQDQDMYRSFISFYNTLLGDSDLCYVSGKMLPSTEKHANKIRNAADKAKLISANDASGFTYRGRFRDSNEVASISYEVSQKAHNALKWLINRQGKTVDQRVFLIWGNDDVDVPTPEEDVFAAFTIPEAGAKKDAFTNQEFAHEFAKALDGYKNDLAMKADVNIMILDSATTGRLAVLYYRNLNKEIYLDRIIQWHSTCVWRHHYQKNENGERILFYGAPAMKDIAFAAYGPRAGDKLVKGVMERVLPCIVDGKNVPYDIVRSAIQRASNPVSVERWEWEKTLSITCALVNQRESEGHKVALDITNQDRSYLFGRLLAVADVLERRALGSDETRSSNAIRYMNSFSRHPERTWKTIQAALQPYQAKLGTKGSYLSKLIDEVATQISFEDFNNKPLSGKYLLGFYSQRHELYQKKEDAQQPNDTKGSVEQ